MSRSILSSRHLVIWARARLDALAPQKVERLHRHGLQQRSLAHTWLGAVYQPAQRAQHACGLVSFEELDAPEYALQRVEQPFELRGVGGARWMLARR